DYYCQSFDNTFWVF
nr:immunoglobulin light chain junction region [Macaca mulatta]MOW56689.1 immunoglobulin light chain junction region [Macaca mulatta]MOW56763.1 immunoglobulin light chain junction region [Macaca mulatta]MOW56815.1 immunoglobulin light chain junction region [Macaca mulatta]MOW58347.1 immunoglobulin light chain junction region [Macaca mulatta]